MKLRLLAASLMLTMSATTFAASDGTVGATSTGTAVISVELPKLILATGFADLDFGTYAGTGALADDEDIRVSMNFATPTYSVIATADTGSFNLNAGGADNIPFTLSYNDQTGTAGRVAMTYNTLLTAQGGGHDALATATDNANYSVDIAQAALQAVDAGAYTATVTFVFTPE